MCFFRSLLFANLLSQPSNSHWNGFSPVGREGVRENKDKKGEDMVRCCENMEQEASELKMQGV